MGFFNEHAMLRMSQRNISESDIRVVLRFARCLHRAGADFFFLGRRDLPDEISRKHARLVGTVLVFVDGALATTYRNKKAISFIKTKPRGIRPRYAL